MKAETKILQEALHLKPVERLHLIESLVQSLNKPDENIEKIWAEESEKRYEALTKGKVKTILISEVKKKIKKMKVLFIEPAYHELEDAIEYYNHEVDGLGDRFYTELLSTINLIEKFPETWSHNSQHTQRAVLKIFPFNVIYTVWNKKIYIIAIAHQHREPYYWIERLNNLND